MRAVWEPGRDGGQLDGDGCGNARAFECIEEIHLTGCTSGFGNGGDGEARGDV